VTDKEMLEKLTGILANPDQVIADFEEYMTLCHQIAEFLEKEDISAEEFKTDFIKHRIAWEAMSLQDRIKYVQELEGEI
jgi:hypothetical protein